jgi:hypothetical protein
MLSGEKSSQLGDGECRSHGLGAGAFSRAGFGQSRASWPCQSANEVGGNAWPSVATLARYANLTERATQKVLGKLAKDGHIIVKRNQGGSPDARADSRPNLYQIVMQSIAPSANDGVNAGTPREVNSRTPRQPNGVNSRTERGELLGPDGVSPSSPEPYLNRPLKQTGIKLAKKKSSDSKTLPEIPDSLSRLDGFSEAWAAYLEMRSKHKKHGPVTPRVAAMAFKKLAGFAEQGTDPVEMVERSALSSWADFYVPDQNRRANATMPDQSNHPSRKKL